MKNKNEIKTQIKKPNFINESNEKKGCFKNLLQENANIQKKFDKLMLDEINLRVKNFFKEINDSDLFINDENDKKIYDLILNTFVNKFRKLNEEIAYLFANYYLNEEYNFLPISFNKNDIKILLKNENKIQIGIFIKTIVELKIKYEIKFKKLTINNDDSLIFNIIKKY